MGEFPCSRSSSKAANRRGKWRLEPGTAQPCPPWQGALTAQNWIIGGKKWAHLEEKRGLEINRQRFEGLEGPWVNELPSLRCDSDQKKTTWGVELSSPTKWTVTSIIWLLALSEPAAQRNGEGGDGRHLTTEMMLAVLPLSLDFERLTSKYCDSPNVIISISQLIHLRSVSQSLCLNSIITSSEWINYLRIWKQITIIIFNCSLHFLCPFLVSGFLYRCQECSSHPSPLSWIYIWQ